MVAGDNNVRIAIVGNVDSGKSTLVGVLAKGMPDDGRGSAREKVFNFTHEKSSGRTSSIAQEIMGFTEGGKQFFPERFVQKKNLYWSDVMQNSSKVISLIDLCGHEKYLKTTLLGLMGIPPDYVVVVVGANMGVSRMTKEHIGIAISLDLPIIVVITKIDMVLPETLAKTIDDVKEIFNRPGLKKKIQPIEYEEEDVKANEKAAISFVEAAEQAARGEAGEERTKKFGSMIGKTKLSARESASLDSALDMIGFDRICPLFLVSSVTYFGIMNLTQFFYKLRPRISKVKGFSDPKEPIEFDVHEHLHPTGVGDVVSGLLRTGIVRPNTVLNLGPDAANGFKQVVVKTIHFNRIKVDEAIAGQFCCFAIRSHKANKELERKDFRKGVVLLDPAIKLKGSYGFEARVSVLHHATSIHEGYECVMHMGVVRQTIKVLKMDQKVFRTGDKGLCTLKFMFFPEYIKPGMTFMLREGRTKVVGEITQLIDNPAVLTELMNQLIERARNEPKAP